MNPLPDRKQQRRNYLKKVGWANIKAVLAGILLLAAGIAAVLSPLGVIYFFFLNFWAASLLCLLLYTVSGLLVGASWRTIERAQREKATLPYVLPATADFLPTDEVLVRAAGEPTSSAEILLRAAAANEQTKAAELLRATQAGEPVVRQGRSTSA